MIGGLVCLHGPLHGQIVEWRLVIGVPARPSYMHGQIVKYCSVIGACTALLQGPLLLHGSSVEVPCKHQSLSTNQQFGRANEVHSKRELGPLLYLSDMKTYDAFARMKNMDTVKQLAAPKSSRLLVEERLIVAERSIVPRSTSRRKPARPPLTKI